MSTGCAASSGCVGGDIPGSRRRGAGGVSGRRWRAREGAEIRPGAGRSRTAVAGPFGVGDIDLKCQEPPVGEGAMAKVCLAVLLGSPAEQPTRVFVVVPTPREQFATAGDGQASWRSASSGAGA